MDLHILRMDQTISKSAYLLVVYDLVYLKGAIFLTDLMVD